MTKVEIEERLDKTEFEPFRINTSDGKHFDIVNPRLVVAMDTRVFIALPENRWTLIALRHVTSLEGLQAA
jgi:hypothetical protein